MIAEILIIPDEIGLDAAKAGAQYVARGLSSIGMKVREQISVCPDSVQFQKAVSTALSRSNILVTLGGMGRESGFLAKTVLSRGLGLPLEQNEDALDGILEYCRRSGERQEPGDTALAMLPRGASAFPGAFGKLPGCAISSAKQHIVMLPENQSEIAPMFNKYVSPYLGGSATLTVTRTIRTYGINESGVSSALSDLMDNSNPAVTVQREANDVLVKVSAHAAASHQAAALCTPVLHDIVARLGDAAYGLDVDSLESAVVAKLKKKGLDAAVAEGGTGGMLARVLGETSHGQDILAYAVSVNSAEDKEQRLGIRQKLLKKWGNLSEYAAVVTADAAREKSGAKIGVAVLAGTGQSRGYEQGTAYIAVCDEDNVYVKKLVVADGGKADPDVVVDAALSRALNMTRLVADYYPRAYTASIPLEQALDNPGAEWSGGGDEQVRDKPSSFWRRNFIIGKTDGRRVKVRKFIFTLSMLIFLVSACYVGLHYYTAYNARRQAEELQNMFAFGEMEDVEVSPDYPKDYSLRFAGLWNANPDVVAFVAIEDTGVKYPIVQADDNDYYLRRDFYGKSNKYGIPFMDYRVNMKKTSDNAVIYGHNMMDGQIFGELVSYKELDYYKQHPLIDFATVYQDKNKYKIFSVFITNAYESQGPVFAYHDFIDAKSSDDFTRYVSEIERRSLINTTVDVKPGDKLLTLSTCTYEFQDARLVIVARAARKGESEDVDTDGAVKNPSPLMPDIWYQTFGGSKPVGESVADVVTEAAVNRQSSISVSSSVSQLSGSAASATGRDSSQPLLSAAAENSRKSAEEAARVAAAESSKKAAEEAAQKAAEEAARIAAAEEAARVEAENSRDMEINDDDPDPDPDTDPGLDTDGDLLPAKSAVKLTAVNSSGSVFSNVGDANILSRIVEAEISPTFETEAIKAQAVATFSFIANANQKGQTPSVPMVSSPSKKVLAAVAEVLGQAVYYDDKVAFTPYHATSAGKTASAASVWGGKGYPYLVSVDSEVDEKVLKYETQTSISRSRVENLLSQKLGIKTTGDPSEWFELLTYENDVYNGEMSVCGNTKSKITGNKITGRTLREAVFSLRSASFDVDYDEDSDSFIFTTYGYGHGVGMSQNGANMLAREGMTYKEILEHYYPGTTVK